MADLDYIIEILLKARDEASPKIAALKAEIDKLKGTQDAESAERDLGNAIKDTGDEADRSKRKHEGLRTEHERSRRASDEAGRGIRSLSEDLERGRAAHDRSSDSVSGHTKTQQDFADALAKVRKESQDTSSGIEDLDTRISKTLTSWKDFERVLNSGSLSKGEAKIKVRQYASEMRSLAKQTDVGSDSLRDLVSNLKDVERYTNRYKFGSYGGSAKVFDALKEKNIPATLDAIGSKFDDLGVRITGVSSFLRGFFDLAKIGFSQQLITGVLSLAGGLVSVASAATQAGAALAGVFISGLGQAIPMLSIVAASLERFKNILQAVSVAGQAEQQRFYDPTEKQVLQLQQSSQLISANQQLSNSYIQLFEAQQRVRDSQIALTEARYNAQRQITELALAEKDARLQAEGANISLLEAKRQLQIAIQRGDVVGLQQAELAVKEAELGKRKAEFEIPKAEREARLARERGVRGAPTVISAVEGLEGARVGLLQAQQAGEAARRQKQITELQQAARSSKETQYEAQLKFFEKGMSPTELGLTNALIGIEKELKSPDSPLKRITDYFVEPFTNAIERIRSLLKTPSFLGPIDELAKSMGEGLGRLEKATYGPQGTSFFETMAKDASKNIPVISEAIEHLMHLFEDIAKSAEPAFHKLSEDWNNFWGRLDRRDSTPEGISRLEAFFNKSAEYAEKFAHLGAALFDLFKTIGSDAAPQGILTVNSFTESIKGATSWIEGHKSSVVNFFKEAREGLSLLGQLLFGIGRSLIEVFSLSSLRAFNSFIQQIILPALRDVVNLLGFLTKILLDIANAIPGGKATLEAIAALIFSFEALGKVAKPVIELIALFKTLRIVAISAGVAFEAYKLSGFTNLTFAIDAAILKFKELKAASIATAATVESTSAAEAASVVGAEETMAAGGALPGGISAGAGILGGGILSQVARLKSLIKGGVIGLGTYLGASTAGNVIGGEAGEQIKGGAGYGGIGTALGFALGGPLGAGVGFSAGELAHMAISPASTGASSDEAAVQQIEKIKKLITEGNFQGANTLTAGIRGLMGEMSSSQINEASKALGGNLEEIVKRTEEVSKSGMPIQQWSERVGKYLKSISPAASEVVKSIEGINVKVGLVLPEIQSKLKSVFEEAVERYGLKSKKFLEIMSVATASGVAKINEAVSSGNRSAAVGMKQISDLVGNALKTYGISRSEITKDYIETQGLPHSFFQGKSGINRQLQTIIPHAAGGYIPARPGGHIARVGEGGHDEVVLSTDPRHAQRSRALLGQYFSRAPHMAIGGRVRDYPGPEGRVDQGVDFAGPGPVRAVLPGTVKSVGLWPGWPGTGGLVYETMKGLIYIMENFAPLVRAGTKVLAGQVLGIDTGGRYGIETGWANASGTGPLVPYTAAQAAIDKAGGTASTAGGESFARFLGTGAGSGVGGTIQRITVPLIRGGGAIGRVAQNALNLATKAANIYLEKHVSATSSALNFAGVPGRGGSPSVNEVLGKQMMIAAGWPASMWPSLQALWTQESGWNAYSVNQSSGAYGIPQSLGHGHPYNLGDSRAQIAWGLNYIRERYGSPLAAEAHERAFNWYAAGGIVSPHRLVTDHIRRMAVRHLRQKVLKFAQGGRAPWGGRPVPIIAHEGERIMNPAQYHETARLAGTTPGGLDRHLGYDGSPRQSFAVGGEPKYEGQRSQPSTSSRASLELPGMASFFIPGFEMGTFSPFVKLFKVLAEGFKKLSKIKNKPEEYSKELKKFLEEIARSGVFAELQKGREILKSTLTRKVISKGYKERGGQIALGPEGEAGIEAGTTRVLAEETKYLRDEAKVLRELRSKLYSEMKKASKIKDKSKRERKLKELNISFVELQEKQKELAETMSQNIEARYQAETQTLQDQITQINNQYQVVSQEQQTKISKAQALGNLGEVGKLEEQSAASAQAQVAKLTPMLEQAEKIGNKELEASLKQEINSLNQTINSALVERISNAQTLIQRESAKAEAKSGERLGISKVLAAEGKYEAAGREEKAGLTEKQANLLATRVQEEQLKEQALRKGDTAAAITLGEELNKNSVEIAENNLALRENAVVTRELIISQIEATGQFRSGIYSAAQQGIEIIGKTTGFTNVPALIAAAKGREGVLSEERTGLEREAGGIGLGVEGLSPAEILTYLASPAGQQKLKELESHEDKTEKEQLYKLVAALETNAENTLKNAEELARLNGQLNQPQTWSTAAFNSFRTSFFTGMGGLLPTYSAALPPGARPEGLPHYGEGTPGKARGMGSTHIENLNIPHPVEVADPGLFAEELSYHISTTPPTS